MKIAVVGAGATGGFLGAMLARAGEDVTLVARGPHLAAMRENGVRVRMESGDFVARPECTSDLAGIREAEFVFLTLKAHSVPEIAPLLAEVLGPDTAVAGAQNGIPWWYFLRHGGELEGRSLQTVDPGGGVARSIDIRRVIGCVVWPATTLEAPGVIRHIEGTRFTLGEPDGSRSERCTSIASALAHAGLKAPVSRSIRSDIWLKLLGNVAMNPLSALTRATMVEIATHPQVRPVARAMMGEAESVARALGVELSLTVEQRLAGAEKVGHHKTSMLQDLEAGRPLEIDALTGAVVELGDILGIPVPHLRTAYGCVKLLTGR